jgi:putative transposase
MAGWGGTAKSGATASAVRLSTSRAALVRPVAFKFALDVTVEQHELLMRHAGAARLAFNYQLGRVKANLGQRTAEASYGVPKAELTPSLSWSKVSFINEMNAWKTGRSAASPVNVDGSRGLAWRTGVSADVFECASVNAAQALANFSNSNTGVRKGKKAGFPHFKSRRRSVPAFKLRSKSKPGQLAPIRVAGPKALRFPTLGQLRIHGCTKRVRRMLEAGRLHLHGASFRFERGRWWVALQGVATAFHPARRAAVGRHPQPAGMDVGIKSLAVVADTTGVVLHQIPGVKSLQQAQQKLRRANQALARTKPGSNGRRKAKMRLTRLHARIGYLRSAAAQLLSKQLATGLTRLTVEDLNVAGMVKNRTLAKALSDAGLGDLGRLLAYKANWYGCELIQADRWYPSSKTCSGCGQVKAGLTLAERSYHCAGCGLVLDRDVNAAVNLARWPDQPQPPATAATPSEARTASLDAA